MVIKAVTMLVESRLKALPARSKREQARQAPPSSLRGNQGPPHLQPPSSLFTRSKTELITQDYFLALK